jgi:hypothetical protein
VLGQMMLSQTENYRSVGVVSALKALGGRSR